MRSCPCLRCIDLDWDGHGTNLSRLTLRFRDSSQEAGFLAQRRDALITGLRRIICITILGFLIYCGLLVLYKMNVAVNETAQQIRRVQLYAIATIILGLMLIWAVLRCSRLAERLGPAGIEVASITLMTAGLVSAICCLKTSSLTRLFGYDYKEVFGQDAYDSDSSTVLMIDLAVTAFTLGMPVRWCVGFAMDIGASLLYLALVLFIGNAEPWSHVVENLLLLTCLALMASLGKRALELHERIDFAKIIKERSLRATAEFHLSCAERGRDPSLLLELGSEYKPQSKVESHIPSTASGKLFDAFNEDPLHPDRLDIDPALTRLAELGEAEHWRIDEREVKVLKDQRLGHGSFGVVAKGIFCGMIVAVKYPRTGLNGINFQKIPELCNELRVLRHLRHPHIIATHGAIVNPEQRRIALVFELVQGVTLCQFMAGDQCSDKLEPIVLYQIMLGVCLALMYMHTRHPAIVHGDVKSENIMVQVLGDYALPKLLDFGLSRLLTRSPLPMGGTLAWMAPELVLGSGEVKRSADVYSYGRLLAFLATSISPLSDFPDDELRDILTHGPPPLPPWPQTCFFGTDCKDLVHSCIRGKETDRPSMTQVHEKLIGLPESLGLADAKGNLLTNARLVAAHSGKDSAGQANVSSDFSTAKTATAGTLFPLVPGSSEGSDRQREALSALPGQIGSAARQSLATAL